MGIFVPTSMRMIKGVSGSNHVTLSPQAKSLWLATNAVERQILRFAQDDKVSAQDDTMGRSG
jgi:hypothetical protein